MHTIRQIDGNRRRPAAVAPAPRQGSRSSRRASWRLASIVLLLAAALAAGAQARQPKAGEQLKFGVDMARKGLWSEALFRFEQARRLDPSNPRVLNNLAVAYEAVGRFDEALSMYQEALRANPGSRDLKQNYSRFLEFYQGFRPEAASEGEEPEPAPGSGEEPERTGSVQAGGR